LTGTVSQRPVTVKAEHSMMDRTSPDLLLALLSHCYPCCCQCRLVESSVLRVQWAARRCAAAMSSCYHLLQLCRRAITCCSCVVLLSPAAAVSSCYHLLQRCRRAITCCSLEWSHSHTCAQHQHPPRLPADKLCIHLRRPPTPPPLRPTPPSRPRPPRTVWMRSQKTSSPRSTGAVCACGTTVAPRTKPRRTTKTCSPRYVQRA
jgi:hypothetical protein